MRCCQELGALGDAACAASSACMLSQMSMLVHSTASGWIVYLSVGIPGKRVSASCTSLCVGRSDSLRAKPTIGVSSFDSNAGGTCAGLTIGRVCSSQPLESAPGERRDRGKAGRREEGVSE